MMISELKETLLSQAIRRALLVAIPVLTLVACGAEDGADGAQGEQGAAGEDGAVSTGLTRFATVPLGAEVTGLFLTEDGDLFFNAQHPSTENDEADANGKIYNKATIGVVTGVNVNQLPNYTISSPVPDTDFEKETTMVAYGEYQVLAQTGDLFTSTPANGIGSVMSADGLEEVVQADMVDFNGYIPTGANTGYLYTNWEFYPGGMSRMAMTKDPDSGMWTVSDAEMLDFGVYGTIANCFGSVSPWGTPLTSEEWGNAGDNTHIWNDPTLGDAWPAASRNNLAKYIDSSVDDAVEATTFPNTYRYHYIVEITNPTDGDVDNVVPVKHYAMGRYEHENSTVMPDQRTVYLSQDSTDGVFFKFVADVAGDLSAGTLYAAKLTQDAGSNEPATTGFDIEWIELASGNNAEIETWIAEYDSVDFDSFEAGKSSYLTDADAIAWASGDANYPSFDDVYQPAVDAGYEDANTYGGLVTAGEPMDDRIAFLESRKAARAMGATAEWRKFEGISVNVKRAEEAVEGTDLIADEAVEEAYVYFAISDIDRGMIDGEGDIQLNSRVKDCGGIYRMPLLAGYDGNRIEPVIMGATYRSSLDGAETCDVDGLSQPDNVIVMDDGRILIGEDGGQTNNTLWMYDPKVND